MAKSAEEKRAARAAYRRHYYFAKLEAGLCGQCGKQPAAFQRTQCAPCADRVRDPSAKRYAANREVMNARCRATYTQKAAGGRCTKCGGSATPGRRQCAGCAAASRDRSRARCRVRCAEGECRGCRAPRVNTQHCAECRDFANARCRAYRLRKKEKANTP